MSVLVARIPGKPARVRPVIGPMARFVVVGPACVSVVVRVLPAKVVSSEVGGVRKIV